MYRRKIEFQADCFCIFEKLTQYNVITITVTHSFELQSLCKWRFNFQSQKDSASEWVSAIRDFTVVSIICSVQYLDLRIAVGGVA